MSVFLLTGKTETGISNNETQKNISVKFKKSLFILVKTQNIRLRSFFLSH